MKIRRRDHDTGLLEPTFTESKAVVIAVKIKEGKDTIENAPEELKGEVQKVLEKETAKEEDKPAGTPNNTDKIDKPKDKGKKK